MSSTHDELAGVVDLFGALTHAELAAALGELAFKQGQDVDEAALEAEIDAAIAAYALVEYEPADSSQPEDAGTVIAVGPTAFPSLPPNAEDLPHILDYERRSIDRERLASQVSQRLTAEATATVDADETGRATELLDVAYDIEMWAPIETEEIRSKLTAVLPQD